MTAPQGTENAQKFSVPYGAVVSKRSFPAEGERSADASRGDLSLNN
ncbi:hypothetical protein HMPREF7215_1779 [Pyramidobacter piscolens W5455]|uniref:Uncharacterized protein n=1 Tax=Pyramidobacter piscolens W5455 TaxID=352165 RepID=A0ABM9ZVB3_9BACT|nr:hypothetical protein HMPREF7215_1779 [Pyramidobacter piscolens W5455]